MRSNNRRREEKEVLEKDAGRNIYTRDKWERSLLKDEREREREKGV